VTWSGPLASHPLQPAGGSEPSPISADYGPEATSHSILFSTPGSFGYVCGQHSNMQGVVRVVD
jgi:plastocyanin